MPLPDYYALLKIPASASQSDIKRAYRHLARQYHPDLHRSVADQADTLEKQTRLLNEAYKVLGNPQKRADYDRLRQEERERRVAQEALKRRQEQAKREPKMTWVEGIFGFVRELKKAMREE